MPAGQSRLRYRWATGGGVVERCLRRPISGWSRRVTSSLAWARFRPATISPSGAVSTLHNAFHELTNARDTGCDESTHCCSYWHHVQQCKRAVHGEKRCRAPRLRQGALSYSSSLINAFAARRLPAMTATTSGAPRRLRWRWARPPYRARSASSHRAGQAGRRVLAFP